jgi:hypothetical protein
MQRHITAVAALQIGWSILGIIFAIAIFIVLTTVTTYVHDDEAIFIIWAILPAFALLIGVLSILGIAGGIGLFTYKNWARILILILSAIDLINIPVGTALGIYSIWVLVQKETVDLFEKSS